MKVCLINPHYPIKNTEANVKYVDSGYNTPHLGLGYISSYLESNGIQNDLIECMIQNIHVDELMKRICDEKYDAIGISICDASRFDTICILKKIGLLPYRPFVFLGGYSATLSYKDVSGFPNVDCCVLGEGEETVLELMRALEKYEDFRIIPGIAYKEKGVVVVSGKRALISNLDNLPFPRRVLVDVDRGITIIGSRGCRNNCTYCSISSFYRSCDGDKYRFRSAKNIMDEIKTIADKYSTPKKITFYDDSFLECNDENIQRLSCFHKLFKEEFCYIPFNITARASDIVKNADFLPKLKEIGLSHVFLGIETFSQRQLALYNKKTSKDENLRAIEILADNGITAEVGFIPLDPYTSLTEVRDNFEVLKNSRYFDTFYKYGKIFTEGCFVMAVKGTPFRSRIENDGLFTNNERGYQFTNSNIEVLFDFIKRWNRDIEELRNQIFCVDTALDTKNRIAYEVFLSLNKMLAKMSIEYVIGLCDAIENEEDVDRYHSSQVVLATHLKEIYSLVSNIELQERA